MSKTPNNAIPYAAGRTLDPAASLNQALDTIDALLQIEVLGIQYVPPASATDGARYIVDTGSGDRQIKIASWPAAPCCWKFLPAKVALNQADGLLYINRPAILPQITGDTSGVVGQMLGALG
ncbi:DUF2793 domain-containing protein [Microbulbifer sp. JMSA003]|uniref:DUF2793 domain-containing protein n=1 Tax=Microbulbifer sp. JMSA003 TaxID=3243369 RepID=UPI00403918DE